MAIEPRDEIDTTLPALPWPRAPSWTAKVVIPSGDARPGTVNACLAWLKSIVDQSEPMLKEIAGAVRTIVKVAHRVDEPGRKDLPADPQGLRPYLRDAMPAAIGVSRSRFNNAKSLVTSLLILAGWVSPHCRSRAPLPPFWVERLAGSGRDLPAGPLPAFFRWCEREGILPEDIRGSTAEEYEFWLTHQTLDLRPRHTSNAVLTSWRLMQRTRSSWPRQELKMASRKPQHFWDVSAFPSSFAADLNGYLASLRRPPPFDADYGKPLGKISINHIRRSILRAATILVQQGKQVEEVSGIACLVTPASFEAVMMVLYYEGLLRLDAAGEEARWTRDAYDVAGDLRLAGKRWVKSSAEIQNKLIELSNKIKPRFKDLSEKVQKQLAQFRTEEERRELYNLPAGAFRVADKMLAANDKRRAAKLHEAALALAIDLRHLPRREDLAKLDIERNIVRDRKGRTTHLEFKSRKTSTSSHTEFDPDLAARVDRHIDRFRCWIPGHDKTTALFPTPSGEARGGGSLGDRLSDLVEKQLGKSFTTHLARHLAVDIIFDADPENLGLAQRSLGHKNRQTTEDKYGSRATLASNREFQRILRAKAGEGSDQKRRGGK